MPQGSIILSVLAYKGRPGGVGYALREAAQKAQNRKLAAA